jgi:hypothetical protein
MDSEANARVFSVRMQCEVNAEASAKKRDQIKANYWDELRFFDYQKDVELQHVHQIWIDRALENREKVCEHGLAKWSRNAHLFAFAIQAGMLIWQLMRVHELRRRSKRCTACGRSSHNPSIWRIAASSRVCRPRV